MAIAPLTYPAGTLGFDTDHVLTQADAYCMHVNNGYEFVARYTQTITSAEAIAILNGGLGLILVQGYRTDSTFSSLEAAFSAGQSDAQAAIQAAKAAGYPFNCTLFVDIENFPNIDQSAAYAQGWAATVNNDGYYGAGVYTTPATYTESVNSMNFTGSVPAQWLYAWENPTCLGSISGANIEQFGPSCAGFAGPCGFTIDNDKLLTDVTAFWG